MSVILSGFGWIITQSDWKISRAEQIQIEGNQYLSDQTVRSILAIPYPQLIIELAPAQLTAKLLAQGSIASAKIDRRLLPPRLIVQIQDLPPVAGVMASEHTEAQTFVNELGHQLPRSSYNSTVWKSLPKLKLRLPTSGICPDFAQLSQVIRTSPVAVGIIDCRNPQNLFLQTEVGKVRLGENQDRSRLTHQIQQLDLLRNWQQATDPTTVDYIDLENPDLPKFQLKSASEPVDKSVLDN